MLKSFEYIKNLSEALELLMTDGCLIDYHIKLNVNQQLDVYISSDTIKNINTLRDCITNLSPQTSLDFYIDSVMFQFFTSEESEDKNYYFQGQKADYGLRRSLDSLINKNIEKAIQDSNVITFYSHKGGVGRTTSLALLASYLSEQGKKIFIIDCDFEAPGLLNFFSISQFDTPKNGVVEYLNDKRFDARTVLNENYVYQVSNKYSNDGVIHLMPAGNVFSLNKKHYLEGLSRLDTFGPSMFLGDMKSLISDIKDNYTPDIILIDSRTGFNNVFGVLSKVSDHVVALFGDDTQNLPGMEFILDKYSDPQLHSKLTAVLSIVSNNIRQRLSEFTAKISNFTAEYGNDYIIPTFVFPREAALEMIGTVAESPDDFKYFSSKNSPTSYTPFFSHMEKVLDHITEKSTSNNNESVDEYAEGGDNTFSLQEDIAVLQIDYAEKIVEDLLNDFPELYAENISFSEDYLRNKFYLRKCMQDIFLPEYKLLLGGKGTGKTFFYKALQNTKFVEALISRAERKSKNYLISNIVSEVSSPQGFIELTSQFDSDFYTNESYVRKFWVVYIWAVLSSELEYNISCDFLVKNDAITAKKIKNLIFNEEKYIQIEHDIDNLDKELKHNDQRLIITFDQLDHVVKPMLWDNGISPLIRICQSNPWERIQPKLFLRRDLFEKLGNITNKKSLESQSIDLEWSADEMYAFFFKIIYSNSKDKFNEFLTENFDASFAKDNIHKKLSKKNSYNQLPDDLYILKPLVNAFFGKPNLDYVDAYDALYRNIRNANQTISLRPFLDMIKFAIEEQIKDHSQKRGNAVLGIQYCFLRSVRAKAVERYFQDMAQEAGNDVIKFFIEDIQNNKVPSDLKCSSLIQKDFEKLVNIVKDNHPQLNGIATTTFEEMLKLNGIIFVTLIPGGIKKFSFAYLYKFYLNLNSPAHKRKIEKKER